MNLPGRWAVLFAALLALTIWWKPIAAWAHGVIELFRDVDDWLPTCLAIPGLALIIIMSLSAARGAAYGWVLVLGPVSLYGVRRRSTWTDGLAGGTAS